MDKERKKYALRHNPEYMVKMQLIHACDMSPTTFYSLWRAGDIPNGDVRRGKKMLYSKQLAAQIIAKWNPAAVQEGN